MATKANEKTEAEGTDVPQADSPRVR
jgi:hypothetical protein